MNDIYSKNDQNSNQNICGLFSLRKSSVSNFQTLSVQTKIRMKLSNTVCKISLMQRERALRNRSH